MFKKSDWKPLLLGTIAGALIFFGATVKADEMTEQFEPVDIPDSMYFIYGMYWEGEARPVPEIYGPMTADECGQSADWAKGYADMLSDRAPQVELYFMASCITEDELKSNSV